MWTTLAIVAGLGLTPAQAGKLDLTNARATYGVLGAPRPDNKVLPGDSYWLVFDIEGIKADETGKVQYGMSFEVVDSSGKTQLKEAEAKDPLIATNHLGGNRLPASAHVDVGVNMPAGKYTLKVTVTDRTAKTSGTLTREFEVLKPDLGLVRLGTSYDAQGLMPAPMLGVSGQILNVTFYLVGFERDKLKTKQPNVHMEVRVLDEAGKPVVAKPPITGDINNGVRDDQLGLPMQFPMALNRPGKFTVEVKATDLLTKKTATLTFPLTVLSTDPKAK